MCSRLRRLLGIQWRFHRHANGAFTSKFGWGKLEVLALTRPALDFDQEEPKRLDATVSWDYKDRLGLTWWKDGPVSCIWPWDLDPCGERARPYGVLCPEHLVRLREIWRGRR